MRWRSTNHGPFHWEFTSTESLWHDIYLDRCTREDQCLDDPACPYYERCMAMTIAIRQKGQAAADIRVKQNPDGTTDITIRPTDPTSKRGKLARGMGIQPERAEITAICER